MPLAVWNGVTWTRRRRALAAVGAALTAVAVLVWHLGGPLWRFWRSPGRAKGPTIEEQLLHRQTQGLTALIEKVERQPLLPPSGNYALLVVDQRLLQSLVDSLVPAEHVIADHFRVTVTDAWIALEDGFALVKMQGRASLVGREDDVSAELSVMGDLEVLRRAPSAEALPARVNVLAVEAHRVDVVMKNVRRAEALVEDLGKVKLSEWASLASSLQIPVRQQYTFEVPGVGGAVRIAAAKVPLSLEVRDVEAFHGKLWISMAASTKTEARVSSTPVPESRASDAAAEAGSEAPLAELRQRHMEKHERLEALLAKDPVVRAATKFQDDLMLVLRADVARNVLGEVSDRYLNHVALELKDLEFHKQANMDKDTFIGRLRVGTWTANVRIHDLEGVLEAGRPSIQFQSDNQVAVQVPVQLTRGRGSATLDFSWDAKGIANVVCKDFQLEERLEGRVIPEEYQVQGKFALTAGPRSLTASPEFQRKMRVRFDLTPASWYALRVRLAAEDRFTRCGMALDPDKLLDNLRALADQGFDVRLPDSLFRTITLPAQVAETVKVAERAVELEVAQSEFRLSPDVLWYGADVKVERPTVWKAAAEIRRPATGVRTASR